MQLTRDSINSEYQINRVADKLIRVNNTDYHTNLIVTAHFLTEWDGLSLEPILDLGPDIVLLGTGADQNFDFYSQFQALSEHGIGLEIMSTPAACRTFSALTADKRNVLAALML